MSMTYDFEGRTEKEAIDKAMEELKLERDSFDIEILEVKRGGFFKKGCVKIRLYINEPGKPDARRPTKSTRNEWERELAETLRLDVPLDAEFEKKITRFAETILEKMGASGRVTIRSRERRKLILNVESADSALIIGKKGRTLDAIQLITSLFVKKNHKHELRIVLDCENYRMHHEESIVHLANSVASKVRSSRRSVLLEPMNAYDRKLIHTTLDKSEDVETRSEGDGLYKQVRVIFKGRAG